jgi:tripartite motif-containing protein 71
MSDRFEFLELDNTRPRRQQRQGAADARQRPVVEPQVLAPAWKIVEVIGGPGTGVGQFASPGGLAVGPEGNLFVADSYNHRVQRITPAGEVWVLGRRGTGPGEFLNPQAVVTDGGLGFWVLEQGGCRVQRFGPSGQWQGAFGFRGGGRGGMLAPMAMARGPCGALFVADSGNGRIAKWSADGFSISIVENWVGAGTNPDPNSPISDSKSPLARPQGIAVDVAGRIWVAETLRHRVLVFDALFRPLAAHGAEGEAPGQFRLPQDLALASDGCLLVADTGNDRVQVLDPAGQPLQVIDRIEHAGPHAAHLNAPSGLAARGPDEIYVADTGNHRVLRMVRV